MNTRLPRIVLVLVLVALMLALTPLAYATSPDPTWIAGFWDDDDLASSPRAPPTFQGRTPAEKQAALRPPLWTA